MRTLLGVMDCTAARAGKRCRDRRGRDEEGREGEREGRREETPCQRQARKDVRGLMRREERGIGKRGWGGHGWESVLFCRQHGSDQIGEPRNDGGTRQWGQGWHWAAGETGGENGNDRGKGRRKVGARENKALVVQQGLKDTTLAIWISLEL